MWTTQASRRVEDTSRSGPVTQVSVTFSSCLAITLAGVKSPYDLREGIGAAPPGGADGERPCRECLAPLLLLNCRSRFRAGPNESSARPQPPFSARERPGK